MTSPPDSGTTEPGKRRSPGSLATLVEHLLARTGRLTSLVIRYLIIWVAQAAALLLLAGSFDSISVAGPEEALIVIGIGASVSATVLPSLIRYAVKLNPLLFPVISFLLTAWVLLLLDQALDGFRISNFLVAGLTAAVLTMVAAFMGSMLSISDDAAWRRFALGPVRARFANHDVMATDVPGFVFLEIDGLSEPALTAAMTAGYTPNLKHWLESGTHRLTGWETDLSSQTSASQAGILLGANDGIPAFRWYDRTLGRVVVSNRAGDAGMLQHRLSTGHGLLADGGASRGNLFSGDAPDSLFTFATVRNGSRTPTRQYYLFYSNVFNLSRTLALFISDIVLELVAATWQVVRNERPRIRRFGVYPLVRAATTSILRELNTFTIAGDILRGVPSMYTTYVAYDEVAHHSGILRGDTLRVLRQVDRDIGRLARVAMDAPRPYHLIVLSDHGQTQGATFRQRYGQTLGEVVSEGIGRESDGAEPRVLQDTDPNDEGWGNANALITDFLGRDTSDHPVMRRALRRQMRDGEVALHADDQLLEQVSDGDADRVLVLASGNLGLISFTGLPRRPTMEEITSLHPYLVQSLVEHPGIAFVAMTTNDRGAIVIGRAGVHGLDDAEVKGDDPLAPYGPHVANLIATSLRYENAPDILVIGTWWRDSDEVAAFEELVGSHGGLGGGQTRPFLLHPDALDPGTSPIVGSQALHHILKGWVVAAQSNHKEPRRGT